jgi:plastocyanin
MDPPRLSREAFWFCLGASIALFLIIDNPLLDDPFDIAASIVWSYLAIPVLVAVFLVIQHKWDVRSLVLESALLIVIKFGITYTLAAVLWMFAGDPPQQQQDTTAAIHEKVDRAYTVSNEIPNGVVVVEARAEVSPPVQVEVGQTIVIAPPDDRLHTAFATRANGSVLFNVPLPSGKRRAVTFHHSFGEITLRCTVHQQGEHYPTLVVE